MAKSKKTGQKEAVEYKHQIPADFKTDVVAHLNSKGYKATLEGNIPTIYTDNKRKDVVQPSEFCQEIKGTLEKLGYAGSFGIKYECSAGAMNAARPSL